MNKKAISLVVGLICVAITVASVFVTLNRNFLKIPVFAMVMGEDKIDESMDEFDQYYEDFDEFTDEELEAFEEETGLTVEKVEDFFENPSLNNLIEVASRLEDLSVDSETIEMFKVVRTVLVVYGAVIALFSLMGALFRKKALTIIALIISIIFYIFIVGWLAFVLFAVASIVHIALIPKKEKAVETLIN